MRASSFEIATPTVGWHWGTAGDPVVAQVVEGHALRCRYVTKAQASRISSPSRSLTAMSEIGMLLSGTCGFR